MITNNLEEINWEEVGIELLEELNFRLVMDCLSFEFPRMDSILYVEKVEFQRLVAPKQRKSIKKSWYSLIRKLFKRTRKKV